MIEACPQRSRSKKKIGILAQLELFLPGNRMSLDASRVFRVNAGNITASDDSAEIGQ